MISVRTILVLWLTIFMVQCNTDRPRQRGTGNFLLLFPPEVKVRTPSPCNTSATPTDPLYTYQWHLKNTGQANLIPSFHTPNVSGNDINVASVWASGNKGQDVVVSVVDDGLELDHPDLTANITEGSVNFSPNSTYDSKNPGGILAFHGTAVGGIIASRDGNGIGGQGVAPCSGLVGFNFLGSPTDANLITSLSGNLGIHVSNNSWGPSDELGTLASASPIWVSAVTNGVANGRNNLGTIYLWAAGNGSGNGISPGDEIDNSNYDPQANHYTSIAVGALNNDGKKSLYSESGANLWVSAFGGRDSINTTGITTTDLTNPDNTWGFNPGGTSTGTTLSFTNFTDKNYTNSFNGTSAATPMAAGVVALMLKENPQLSWRDVKLILAESAKKNDSGDTGWLVNAGTKASGASGNYNFNPKYGFGRVDVSSAVALAKTWRTVGGNSTLIVQSLPALSPGSSIPQGSALNSVTTAHTTLRINRIEYVAITVTINHPQPGQLEINLISPSGTRVNLYNPHTCYTEEGRVGPTACNAIAGYTFGASAFLGESPRANPGWTLSVTDRVNDVSTGTLTSWSIQFFGR